MNRRKCLVRASYLRYGVIFVVVIMSAATGSTAHGQAFRDDIDRWVAQDVLDPPPANAVVFAGSSSIRRWERLTRDFFDYDIIQRGFGGSHFSDLNGFVNDVVLPYDPAAVVVFEGTNDLAGGKSPAAVFNDYLTFVNSVHSAQPDTPILYIGITPTPARWSQWSSASQVNSLIESHAQDNSSLFYLDIPAPFLATGTPPDSSLFLSDGLHLTQGGYDIWTSVIRPAFLAASPSQKVFTPNLQTPDIGGRVLFDFGPSNPQDGDHTTGPDANGNIWNNWHAVDGGVDILAGQHIGNLVTTGGVATGIDLVVTGGFSSNGKVNGGLFNPDSQLLGDLAVQTATEDYFFSTNEDTPGGFMLTGLDPDLYYDFRFFATRDYTEERITQYTVMGKNESSDVLRTSGRDIGSNGFYDGNDQAVASATSVRPTAFGEIFVNVDRISGSFAYVNIMELTVVPEPSIFTSLVSGKWNSVSTWDHGEATPSIADDVIIGSHIVTVTDNEQADSLEITKPNGNLVVDAGAVLDLTERLTATAGSNVEIVVGGEAPGQINAGGNVFVSGSRLHLAIDAADPFKAGTYELITSTGPTGIVGSFLPTRGLGAYVSQGTRRDGLENTGTEVTLTIDFDLNPGDANLNRTTDLSDFNYWNANKFTAGTSWRAGDFNGDGLTDLSDFNIWNANKFTVAGGGAAPAPTEVPEPGALILLGCALAGMAVHWRRKQRVA